MPRPQSIEAMLDYECRKKPDLAMVRSRLEMMTEDEILGIKALPWIKKAFLAEKKRLRDIRIIEITIATMKTVEGFSANPSGFMRRYVGMPIEMELDRGAIELKDGKLIWFPDSGGVWLETIYSKKIDARIIRQSVAVGTITMQGYMEAYRDALNSNKLLHDAPVIFQAPGTEQPAKGMFQIYRV